MDITFLTEFAVPIIVGICLVRGLYRLRTLDPVRWDQQVHPGDHGSVGVALNVWINLGITPQILLGGLFPGWRAPVCTRCLKI